MSIEKEFDRFKRKQKELLNRNATKTFYNVKESSDDAIAKDVDRILKKYDITLDNLMRIVSSMQENKTNTEEDFKNEE